MSLCVLRSAHGVLEGTHASEIAEAYTRFIQLLDRTLRMRRATTGFVSLLRDEVIAYQLVWPN